MQLEGRVAARLAGQGELGVGLGRVQTARQIVAAHRARVGRDAVAVAAEQLVDRLAQRAPGQIPQRGVDRAQHPVVERAHVQEIQYEGEFVKGVFKAIPWLADRVQGRIEKLGGVFIREA